MLVSLKNGNQTFEVNQNRYDFSKYKNFESYETTTDTLVMYDKASDTVTVDSRVDDFYAKYATIHECICCGKYGYLAPEVQDEKERCAAIDAMLMSTMSPSDRSRYIQQRIEMFETMLARNLNPSMEQTALKSLDMLRSTQ